MIAPANPITTVSGECGDIVNSVQLHFADGTATNVCAGGWPGGPYSFSYPGHVVSTIKVMGVSDFYETADCAIFGFRMAGADGDAAMDGRHHVIVGQAELAGLQAQPGVAYWTADHGDANDMQATYGYTFDPVPCGWVFYDGWSAGRWAQPDVDDPSVPDKARALTATEPLYRLLA